MSEETTNVEQPGRSWREIRQDVSPRALSAHGRRRRQLALLKYASLLALAGAVGWGLYTVAHTWESDRAALAAAVKSEKVRDVVLITDGVLTQQWLNQTLALPRGVTLMAVDLAALRARLLAHGQVRVAVLTRSFPDTLVVTLQERTPVVRLRADDGSGPKSYFVARDGVVYEGFNYDPSMVATLPWLDGVRLARRGGKLEPIAGMETVTSLLMTAQLQAPHLYATWQIVSLARLAEREEIVVKSQDVPEIVFSRKQEFFRQLAQLDYVIDTSRQLPDAGLVSVNLGLGGQVPVKLAAGTPAELAKRKAKEDSQLQFNLPSQRKEKRDL